MIISGFRFCVDVESRRYSWWCDGRGWQASVWTLGSLALQWSRGKPWPVLQCRHSPATSHTAYLQCLGRGYWSCDGRGNCRDNT